MKTNRFESTHRTLFPILALVLAASICAQCRATSSPSDGVNAQQLIARAGNAEDEQVRFGLLQQTLVLPGLDPAIKKDLEDLLPILDYWANKSDFKPDKL
jgi:MoaA/NifB/PqqE/SkfB family radical SAM enzyme